ncbi:hypothetical protein K437DRAFT_255841 [Tilletiaria anomala UBC 951]|uniref:NADH-ubiquinone oxidoreductase B15 subunit n=1 Tax=Tilletiaria anomala (strain ATCC 24038 / CBS 436.72 / UBC 951) TaxID=1037660 RepID=A0A066W906_TILAU|nr:uncharacterized protein K437DRAFT_255841 [Tilletiaria anomala UBC 951]KDN47564.1 hypothetical protein K437DRAFT_255841 [Tilletiaria anomala UBC 951]
MAGDHHSFKVDPAIERWQAMHSSMHERFRFTPSKTRVFLFWGIAIPALTYGIAKFSDNRWDWRAKTREDSLLTAPPKSVNPTDEE